MNYQPVVTGNQPNHNTCNKENIDVGKVEKETESDQQYVLLPLWSTGSKYPQNTDVDAAFDVKENESKVHVSPSSSDKKNKHDDKAKREAKGKNMPALEYIVYSDDEEDIGAEADFSNLETSIAVSPIPTTRVHKDHHVTQIIGDLTSAPQTRRMARMVKEQGFEDPDYPDKVYKVVKELYRLHQAPRAWYETLANYLLEYGYQRGKIDQTLFIKKKKDGKSASTPIDTEKPLLKDPD
nr:putative ribonuclease H-like domain-containing protein [Tanacetum cinerariifolium]